MHRVPFLPYRNGSSISLVQWLEYCRDPGQEFVDLAGPQDFPNPDLWFALVLLALRGTHQVLLIDFGCQWSIDGPV